MTTYHAASGSVAEELILLFNRVIIAFVFVSLPVEQVFVCHKAHRDIVSILEKLFIILGTNLRHIVGVVDFSVTRDYTLEFNRFTDIFIHIIHHILEP